jgi:hypothetical protein
MLIGLGRKNWRGGFSPLLPKQDAVSLKLYLLITNAATQSEIRNYIKYNDKHLIIS